MKQENQPKNEITLAASPYREAIKPEERKLLSKEQAKALVEIVRGEYEIVNHNYFIYGTTNSKGDRIDIWGEGFYELLRLGYTNYGNGTYAKDATFYRVKKVVSDDMDTHKILIVSGNFYGNLNELMDDFKKFDDFSDYARKGFGNLEAMCIFPLLGLLFYSRSRELHKCAMKLPQEFANYKYGKDALEQLRVEYKDMQSKAPAIVLPKLNPLKFPEPPSEKEMIEKKVRQRKEMEKATAFDKKMRELREKPNHKTLIREKIIESLIENSRKDKIIDNQYYIPKNRTG